MKKTTTTRVFWGLCRSKEKLQCGEKVQDPESHKVLAGTHCTMIDQNIERIRGAKPTTLSIGSHPAKRYAFTNKVISGIAGNETTKARRYSKLAAQLL